MRGCGLSATPRTTPAGARSWSGPRLGKVLFLSEATGRTPPRGSPGAPKTMPAAVPLEPGQQTVRFSVTAVRELD